MRYRDFFESKNNALDKRTLSPNLIAKKHNISVQHILNQLKKGITVEKEHTSNAKIATEIALDHLSEDPNYYDKLDKLKLESKSEQLGAQDIVSNISPVLTSKKPKKQKQLMNKFFGSS